MAGDLGSPRRNFQPSGLEVLRGLFGVGGRLFIFETPGEKSAIRSAWTHYFYEFSCVRTAVTVVAAAAGRIWKARAESPTAGRPPQSIRVHSKPARCARQPVRATIPMYLLGVPRGRLAQLVRVLARHARGQWFESTTAHHFHQFSCVPAAVPVAVAGRCWKARTDAVGTNGNETAIAAWLTQTAGLVAGAGRRSGLVRELG